MSSVANRPDSTLNLRYGTYEEAREWIGRKSEIRFCEDEVNWAQIKFFCSLIEDANPNYWDEDEARRRYGAIISPPAMMMVWWWPLRWRPSGAAGHPFISTRIPLPGNTVINVSTESEFLLPVRIGERLNVQDEVVDITPEKHTRLGVGHFITTVATYRNQRGEVVTTQRNVLFRFSSGERQAASR